MVAAMARTRTTPSFKNLRPSSSRSSRSARASSGKSVTRCEVALRSALWTLGLRYRVAVRSLAGRPDIVFLGEKVAVFCDGDFWHGKDLESREKRLQGGHNASYWIAKIRTNVARDKRQTELLQEGGWLVLHFWESEIRRNPILVAEQVAEVVRDRRRVAYSAKVRRPPEARPHTPQIPKKFGG